MRSAHGRAQNGGGGFIHADEFHADAVTILGHFRTVADATDEMEFGARAAGRDCNTESAVASCANAGRTEEADAFTRHIRSLPDEHIAIGQSDLSCQPQDFASGPALLMKSDAGSLG